MEAFNKCTGKLALPCDEEQKAVMPGSGLLLFVPISLCVSFTGTLPYRRHWSVCLPDEIFLAVF